jgi:hypothetical protein
MSCQQTRPTRPYTLWSHPPCKWAGRKAPGIFVPLTPQKGNLGIPGQWRLGIPGQWRDQDHANIRVQGHRHCVLDPTHPQEETSQTETLPPDRGQAATRGSHPARHQRAILPHQQGAQGRAPSDQARKNQRCPSGAPQPSADGGRFMATADPCQRTTMTTTLATVMPAPAPQGLEESGLSGNLSLPPIV